MVEAAPQDDVLRTQLESRTPRTSAQPEAMLASGEMYPAALPSQYLLTLRLQEHCALPAASSPGGDNTTGVNPGSCECCQPLAGCHQLLKELAEGQVSVQTYEEPLSK